MKKMKVNCDHSYYESKEDPNHSFVVNENNRMLWKVRRDLIHLNFCSSSVPRLQVLSDVNLKRFLEMLINV